MQCVPSCKPADPSEAPVGFGQVANTVLHLRAAEEGFKRADRKQSMEVLTPRHDAAERSASVVGCVFAMLATIVGGGALSLPYALKSLGVLKGLAILAVAAVASDLSLLALCSASRRTGIVALPQLARHTHGKKAEVLCSVSLLVLCAFVAVAYVSLLRDMLALATGWAGNKNMQHDFNMNVFARNHFAVCQESTESKRSVQKSAETTSI